MTSCGSDKELEILEAIEKFRKFYEEKMKDIDSEGGGDCLELQLQLQERWINDLTEQTRMMAKIVKELEEEATSRVQMLEEKLRVTSKTAYELRKDNEERRSEEIEILQMKLQDAENLIRSMKPCVTTKTTFTMIEDDVHFKIKDKRLEEEISRRQLEVEDLKCRCSQLEKALENSQAVADNLQKAVATRGEVKKLRQQKRCYQHALECLKNEMTVMSEQLISLQEILNFSKQSCIEDKGQLHNAIVNLQKICDRLQAKLIEAEKKILLENQMNQLKDQKIEELQVIIGQKNADLNVHDAAIHDMKMKLEHSVLENHQLQNTIAALNSTIAQLRCDSAKFACRRQTVNFKEDLPDGKKSETALDKLKMDFRSQTAMLKSLQKDFENTREKNKEKTRHLKRQVEALQDKLAKSEMINHQLIGELEGLKVEATELTEKEYSREQELVRSKQVVIELRQTLIELNESLINSELHHTTIAEAFELKIRDDRQQQEDIYMSCRCEIALYKRLVEDFKETLISIKKKFAEVENQNQNLRDELKYKENKLNEMQEKYAKKEFETCENVKELMKKLERSQAEEKRLTEFIEHFKREVQKKIEQRNTDPKTLGCICHDKKNDTRVAGCACNDVKQDITDNGVPGCICNDRNKENIKVLGCICNDVKQTTGCICNDRNKDNKVLGCVCNDGNRDPKLPGDANKNPRDTKDANQVVGCICSELSKDPRVLDCVCNDGSISNWPSDDITELESSQLEIKTLKTQIEKLLQSQFSLNNENDKLLKQVTCLQTALSQLEDKNRQLKQKLEKSQHDTQIYKEQVKAIQREKEILAQTITNLEVELADVRNTRDDVCAESKHVVNNVKAWLEEQKKINDKVKKKTQCYCDTIAKLKQENAHLLNDSGQTNTHMKNYNRHVKCYSKPYSQSPPPNVCTPPVPPACFDYPPSPWFLGSQGMESPRDSPTSFRTCSIEEWYSPNFRDETDFDTDDFEDDFINRLEAATLEMKNNNKMFKRKYRECDCTVTKDKK